VRPWRSPEARPDQHPLACRRAHERPPRVLLTEPGLNPPPPWSPVDPAGTPTRPVRPVGQGLAGPSTAATYATLAHRDGVGREANTASLSRSPGLRSHTAGVESTPCSSGRAVNQSPTGWRRVGAGRRPIALGQMQRAPPAGKASCLGPSPDRTRPGRSRRGRPSDRRGAGGRTRRPAGAPIGRLRSGWRRRWHLRRRAGPAGSPPAGPWPPRSNAQPDKARRTRSPPRHGRAGQPWPVNATRPIRSDRRQPSEHQDTGRQVVVTPPHLWSAAMPAPHQVREPGHPKVVYPEVGPDAGLSRRAGRRREARQGRDCRASEGPVLTGGPGTTHGPWPGANVGARCP